QSLLLEDLAYQTKTKFRSDTLISRVSERFIPGLYHGSATWINVHGFGVGWYTDTLTEFDPSITAYRHASRPVQNHCPPISTDLAFAQLCGHWHMASKVHFWLNIRDVSFPPVVEVKQPSIHLRLSFRKIRYDIMRRIFDLQTIVQIHQCKSSVQDSNYDSAALYFAHLDIIQANGAKFQTVPTRLMRPSRIIHEIQFQHQVGPFTPWSWRGTCWKYTQPLHQYISLPSPDQNRS
ncbi:hypothetical protein GGU10DRAFT_350605, partial [Lentinula aff. detonsa]